MNEKEVMEEIQSKPKFYVGIYASSTAFNIIRRWKEKRITLSKLHEFFNAFGYYRATDDHWYKYEVK